jgi:hypothetical protein
LQFDPSVPNFQQLASVPRAPQPRVPQGNGFTMNGLANVVAQHLQNAIQNAPHYAHAQPQSQPPLHMANVNTQGAYVSPAAREAQLRAANPYTGASDVQTQAAAYGAQRLALLRQLQPSLGIDVPANSYSDPAAAWRAASAVLTQQAHAAGYMDPRQFIVDTLAHQRAYMGRH